MKFIELILFSLTILSFCFGGYLLYVYCTLLTVKDGIGKVVLQYQLAGILTIAFVNVVTLVIRFINQVYYSDNILRYLFNGGFALHISIVAVLIIISIALRSVLEN